MGPTPSSLCSILELSIEKIEKKLGQNCFENMVSDFWKKISIVPFFTFKKKVFIVESYVKLALWKTFFKKVHLRQN